MSLSFWSNISSWSIFGKYSLCPWKEDDFSIMYSVLTYNKYIRLWGYVDVCMYLLHLPYWLYSLGSLYILWFLIYLNYLRLITIVGVCLLVYFPVSPVVSVAWNLQLSYFKNLFCHCDPGWRYFYIDFCIW